jgi:tripartite ATP-independent transporter DctP family solute receptor
LSAPTATLRLGGYQGENSVHTRALRRLADVLARAAEPAFDVAMRSDITIEGHRAADLLAMTEDGRLELCYFASSYLAARVPSLGAFDLPFAAADRAAIYRELDGEMGARVAADVAAATGYRVLAFWDNGFRHFSNRLRPIRRPEDCRGMRLRTLDNALHQRIFAALGFEPVAIDVKDLARAVARHEVDAQENPLTNIWNFGLHRTHRHVSLTSHFYGVALLLMNRAWFDALPEPARAALRAAAADATAVQRELATADDTQCLAKLRDDGVMIVPPQEIDSEAFRRAVAGIAGKP